MEKADDNSYCELKCGRRKEDSVKEFYCVDCQSWICAGCRNAHLLFVGSRDHKMATIAEKQQHVIEPLRTLLDVVLTKIDWYCQQEASCHAALATLNDESVTSLSASVKARKKILLNVNKLFDTIDKQIKLFTSSNRALYTKACTELQQRLSILRKCQNLAEQALSNASTKVLLPGDNPGLGVSDIFNKLSDIKEPEIADTPPSIVLNTESAFNFGIASVELCGGMTQIASAANDATAVERAHDNGVCDGSDVRNSRQSDDRDVQRAQEIDAQNESDERSEENVLENAMCDVERVERSGGQDAGCVPEADGLVVEVIGGGDVEFTLESDGPGVERQKSGSGDVDNVNGRNRCDVEYIEKIDGCDAKCTEQNDERNVELVDETGGHDVERIDDSNVERVEEIDDRYVEEADDGDVERDDDDVELARKSDIDGGDTGSVQHIDSCDVERVLGMDDPDSPQFVAQAAQPHNDVYGFPGASHGPEDVAAAAAAASQAIQNPQRHVSPVDDISEDCLPNDRENCDAQRGDDNDGPEGNFELDLTNSTIGDSDFAELSDFDTTATNGSDTHFDQQQLQEPPTKRVCVSYLGDDDVTCQHIVPPGKDCWSPTVERRSTRSGTPGRQARRSGRLLKPPERFFEYYSLDNDE